MIFKIAPLLRSFLVLIKIQVVLLYCLQYLDTLSKLPPISLTYLIYINVLCFFIYN